MLDKFNFYDLLGYLIPGGTVVLVVYFFARDVVALPVPILPTDLGGSLLFLGLSYAVGHVVQTVGSWYEKRLVHKEGGQRLSERLLDDADRSLSTGLKKRINACASETFGLSAAAHAPDPREGQMATKELFDLCYALTIQKGLGQHTEIFLAINGFARGMIVASGVGFLVSVFAVLNATRLIPLGPMPTLLKSGYNPQLIAGSAGAVAFIIALFLMRQAFRRFRFYFAASVYNNFVAWCGSQSVVSGTGTAKGRGHLSTVKTGLASAIAGFALGAFASRAVQR